MFRPKFVKKKKEEQMKGYLLSAFASSLLCIAPPGSGAIAKPGQPNILFIMGDDVGWYNIGAYHQGVMSGKTPNLDKLAADSAIPSFLDDPESI